MPDPARQPIDIADAAQLSERAVTPILFPEPPRARLNRMIWHGPAKPVEHVAASISVATGQAVGALWRMTWGG
ncbi:MAG: hypothetical protein EXR43_06010 [Dehalococcoidia bacterium]|nr:hypothetical protein [Dehalococcoidia bacterium]